ncbi:sensor histidine kinase [Paenibacillus sp. GCM10023252]|uniref:sensor histidine kinase n=1 Tax=Paenibacillus sp. GCM10023252 TaxID=3252649 RepID=UPI0036131950
MITSIIILVVTAIGSFSFVKSSKAIDHDVERFSRQILKQANLNLGRYMNDSQHFFQTLVSSQELRQWANARNKYETVTIYQSIATRFIEPFVTYHPELLSIMLYNANGNESIYRSDKNPNIYLNTKYSMLSDPTIVNQPLESTTERLILFSDSYTDKYSQSIRVPVLRYYHKLNYDGQEFYIVMDLSLLAMREILDEINLGSNGYAMLVDENGKIVSSPHTELITTTINESLAEHMYPDPNGSSYLEATKEMMVYQSLPRIGWKLLVIIPYSDLAKSITDIRNWTIIMTAAGVLIAIILVMLVARSITKRLKELRRTIKQTRMGNFDIRLNVQGTDEVAELGAAYNLLLDRIDSSVTQLAETKLVQQRAILSALQSQIHSHFFYNALESINSMAHLAGHKEIRRTTVALSNMLRYTSNYQDAVVTIQQEMKHLSDYIRVLESVYRDAIEFKINTDSSIHGAQCLKAIVQPFVENCIKHGYEVMGKGLIVYVHAYRTEEGAIRIDIEDNGTGFTEEKLRDLQMALHQLRPEHFSQLSNIGVLNVCYRLITFYGEGLAELQVARSHYGGARISLLFPYRAVQESGMEDYA